MWSQPKENFMTNGESDKAKPGDPVTAEADGKKKTVTVTSADPIIDKITPSLICKHHIKFVIEGKNFPPDPIVTIDEMKLNKPVRESPEKIIVTRDPEKGFHVGDITVSVAKKGMQPTEKTLAKGFLGSIMGGEGVKTEFIENGEEEAYVVKEGEKIELEVDWAPQEGLIQWNIKDEDSTLISRDWESQENNVTNDQKIGQIKFPEGEVASERKVRVEGVLAGRSKIEATLIVEDKERNETLICSEETTILVEDNGQVQVEEVTPNVVCENEGMVFVIGKNLSKVNSASFGDDISVKIIKNQLWEKSDNLIVLNVSNLEHKEIDEMGRTLQLKYNDNGKIKKYQTPLPVLRIANSNFEDSGFKNTFNLKPDSFEIPESLEELVKKNIRNRGEDKLIDGYETKLNNLDLPRELFRGDLSSFFESAGLYDQIKNLKEQREKSIKASRSSFAGNFPNRIKELLGANPNRNAATEFFGTRSCGARCEIIDLATKLEKVLNEYLSDLFFELSKGIQTLDRVDNIIGPMILTGHLDEEQYKDLYSKAKELLKQNPTLSTIDVLKQIGAYRLQQPDTWLAVGLAIGTGGLGGSFLKFLKQNDEKLWKLVKKTTRGLDDKEFRKNYLRFLRDSKAKDDIIEGLSRLNPNELRGLTRLTTDKKGSKFVKQIIDELPDNEARKLFRLIDDAATERVNISGSGLKRTLLRGKKTANDLKNDLEKVVGWKTPSGYGGARYGSEVVEPHVLKTWQKSKDTVKNLNIESGKLGHGANMRIVDAAKKSGNRFEIASITHGKLKSLEKKFDELLDIRLMGNDPQKWEKALSTLQDLSLVKTPKDFIHKARLYVPNEAVEPLRAVLATRIENGEFRKIASRWGISYDKILDVVQGYKAPPGYFP